MNEKPTPPDKADHEKKKGMERLSAEIRKTEAVKSLSGTLNALKTSGKSQQEILEVVKDIFKKK